MDFYDDARNLPRWTKAPAAESPFADWKINLVVPDPCSLDDVTFVYSVHRIFLGTKSDYFMKLFTNDRFSESQHNQSRIGFTSTSISSNHFETFLDFLYTGNLELGASNAVPMAYFGDYFGITSLKSQSVSFIEELDSSAEEVAAQYSDAKSLYMKDIRQILAKKCAVKPNTMIENSELVIMSNSVPFWQLVWSERMNIRPKESEDTIKDWSSNLGRFLEKNFEDVDRHQFMFFTHESRLPIVSEDAAAILMDHEHRLGISRNIDNYSDDGKDDLTCLQRRCTEALIKSVVGNPFEPATSLPVKGTLRKLQSTVLEYVIIRMMDEYERRKPQVPKPLPSRIEIRGASEPNVNGFYDRAAETDCNRPRYVKKNAVLNFAIRVDSFIYFDESCSAFHIQFARIQFAQTTVLGEKLRHGTPLYSVKALKYHVLPPKSGWMCHDPSTDHNEPTALRLIYH